MQRLVAHEQSPVTALYMAVKGAAANVLSRMVQTAQELLPQVSSSSLAISGLKVSRNCLLKASPVCQSPELESSPHRQHSAVLHQQLRQLEPADRVLSPEAYGRAAVLGIRPAFGTAHSLVSQSARS